jgi:Integrase core domain
MSLGQARETIETWRLDYNAVRPHSALGDAPTREFEQLTRNRGNCPDPLILSGAKSGSRSLALTSSSASTFATGIRLAILSV